MTRRTAALIVVALVAMTIAAVVFFRPDQDEVGPGGEQTEVTVAQFGDLLLYLPLYIAQSEGIFERHGLDVEIVSTGGDDKTYAAVVAGSADFGIADPTFVALAAEQGQQGKVVGLLINGMPNYGVSSDGNAPLVAEAADLAGKTIATAPAPSTSYALMLKLYQSAGLEPSILQVSPAGLVPALRAGEADYALLIEPWVSEVVAGGGQVAFSLSDFFPEFALTGVTTSDRLLGDDPELARSFLRAMTEAVDVFYSDEAAALRAARARFPDSTEEILRDGIQRAREDRIYPQCLTVSTPAWEAAVELRVDIGDLREGAAPIDTYVGNSHAAAACESATTGD